MRLCYHSPLLSVVFGLPLISKKVSLSLKDLHDYLMATIDDSFHFSGNKFFTEDEMLRSNCLLQYFYLVCLSCSNLTVLTKGTSIETIKAVRLINFRRQLCWAALPGYQYLK